jgi:hypothetical protein
MVRVTIYKAIYSNLIYCGKQSALIDYTIKQREDKKILDREST